MERGHYVLASTELDQAAVVDEAIAQMVGYAAAVRARVLYELERMIGLPVASLEVRIDKVRGR